MGSSLFEKPWNFIKTVYNLNPITQLRIERAENERLTGALENTETDLFKCDTERGYWEEQYRAIQNSAKHFRRDTSNARRLLVGGLKAILDLPLFDDIGLAIADDRGEVYLSPSHTTQVVGDRLQKKSLEDLGIDPYKTNFQQIKINGQDYVARIGAINMRQGVDHHAIVLTRPNLLQKAQNTWKASAGYTAQLIATTFESLKTAKDYVAGRPPRDTATI